VATRNADLILPLLLLLPLLPLLPRCCCCCCCCCCLSIDRSILTGRHLSPAFVSPAQLMSGAFNKLEVAFRPRSTGQRNVHVNLVGAYCLRHPGGLARSLAAQRSAR
jgi:hypothetical protein